MTTQPGKPRRPHRLRILQRRIARRFRAPLSGWAAVGVAALASILAAGLTGGLGFWAQHQQIQSSERQQQEQIQSSERQQQEQIQSSQRQQRALLTADRERELRDRQERIDKEIRDKRAAVYVDFLGNATRYRNAAYRVLEQCTGLLGSQLGECLVEGMETSDFLAPRADFQGSVNDVFVFGTEDTRQSMERVVAVLPESGGPLAPTKAAQNLVVDEGRFTLVYREFLGIMRTELRPIVR